MKSIIEQASSIIKAIEKAWNQADNPKEFSIKIFEKEEKNFFGLTTKPAKIGIFYTDKPIIHEKSVPKPRLEIKEPRPNIKESAPKQAPTLEKSQQDRLEQVRTEQPHPTQQKPIARPSAPSQNNRSENTPAEKPQRVAAAWNDTMVNSTQTWLKKTLALMGMTAITFTTEIAGKNLKLTFNQPLLSESAHEQQLFRSFAHLIMSSLRNQYKQEIKDLKVILIRPK